MTQVGKKNVVRHVLTYEMMAFSLIITLIWLDEFIDIPYLILGAVKTAVNWEEALFETIFIVVIAATIIHSNRALLARVKHLEGFLPICASCKKIRNEHGRWQQMEEYIHDHSEANFSHGLCPQCAEKLYPEIFPVQHNLKKQPTDRQC